MSENFSESDLNQKIHEMFLADVDFNEPESAAYRGLVDRIRALKNYPQPDAMTAIDESDLLSDVEELGLLAREPEPGNIEQAAAYSRAQRLGRDLVRRTLASAYEYHEHREEIFYDPMTHALSHRGIEHTLLKQFDIAVHEDAAPKKSRGPERRGQQPVLVFGDLTNFRKIDKLLGQAVGDEALRELVRELQELMRRDDPIARFGGDEFGALLKLTNKGRLALYDRISAAQEEKLTSGRNGASWTILERHIDDMKRYGAAAGEAGAHRIDWRARELGKGNRNERWVCDGTVPLVPLRDLVIFSFDMHPFQYGDHESYRRALVLIQMRMQAQKRRFHELMGGAYRPIE